MSKFKILKDNVIFPRIAPANITTVDYTDITIEHLENFAKEGLRTLVIAYKEISQEEYAV